MKLAVILPLFLWVLSEVHAQSSYPYALETVKFDAISKRVDKIPFDKPFIVELENFSTEGIHKIFVYEMVYDQIGGRCFKRREADIKISASDITVKDTKMTFTLPALKPQKHFDMLIVRKETQPWDKSLDLNKAIFYELNNYSIVRDLAGVEKLFTKLKNSYDGTICNMPGSLVVTGTIDEYLALYNKGLFEIMQSVNWMTGICTHPGIDEKRLQQLSTKIKECCRQMDTAAFLQFCKKNYSMDLVCKGLVKLSDVSVDGKLDTFDLQKRIANLKSTLSTLEVVKKQVAAILNSVEGDNKDIVCDIDSLMHCLIINKKILEENFKNVSVLVDNNFYSSEVLVSTTFSKDLQTESNNRFLLDLGFANLFARDNRDKLVYIPKLSWGVNILLRPVDKAVPLRSLPGTLMKNNFKDNLQAGKSIWHVLSIYVGFTIGSMTEPEFADFYNNNSLLVGPSIRLYRAFRISFGPSLLRRVNANPVITRKEITGGMFASFSVDMDLLKSLSSITSLLTK